MEYTDGTPRPQHAETREFGSRLSFLIDAIRRRDIDAVQSIVWNRTPTDEDYKILSCIISECWLEGISAIAHANPILLPEICDIASSCLNMTVLEELLKQKYIHISLLSRLVLKKACRCNRVDVVRRLCLHNMPEDLLLTHASPLSTACAYGSIDVFDYLCTHFGLKSSVIKQDDNACLKEAVYRNQIEMIRHLCNRVTYSKYELKRLPPFLFEAKSETKKEIIWYFAERYNVLFS